MMYGQKTSN